MSERKLPPTVPAIKWESSAHWSEPRVWTDREIASIAQTRGVTEEEARAIAVKVDLESREKRLDDAIRNVQGSVVALQKWIETYSQPVEDSNEGTGEKQ